MKPTIIIGAGLAGYTLARELRKLDKNQPLLIITADDGSFYSKPMLSNAFAQNKQVAQLAGQTATQMAAQLGAHILAGTPVTGIDTARKIVQTQAGAFEYERLVLAVGAQPVRLALDGDAAHEILSVNHLSDYGRLREHMQRAGGHARIVILGAGLIGCEFADDLSGAGHLVTLVDPNPRPLSALAPAALSHGLAAALHARSVTLRSGVTALRIDREGKALRVQLSDDHVLETDVVMSAVGLRADLRLAQTAGLATARGIQVDRYGRTNVRDVYALGDCAEYCDGETSICLPYIAPLMAAARAIARTLTGNDTAIDLKPAPVIVKTPSYPLALLPVAPGTAGHWHAVQEGEKLICRFYDSAGIMRGFGVAPQDAASRHALLGEMGGRLAAAA